VLIRLRVAAKAFTNSGLVRSIACKAHDVERHSATFMRKQCVTMNAYPAAGGYSPQFPSKALFCTAARGRRSQQPDETV